MRTNSNNTGKYAGLGRISSLKRLRKAQRSLRRDINRGEERMAGEYNNAIRMFSYKSLLCGLLSKADDAQAVIRYAVSGYDMACSLRRRFSKRRC